MDFPNTSGIRSPFSPRVRQSITGRRAGLSSAKKNQSKFMQSTEAPTGDVIYKTPLITLETYGQPLPVLVTEALTFASGEVTVGLSACGYCWLVSGRRLLCWARDGGAARELTLPQTDLQHKAELVEVFYEDGAQMPSCIGVSPEGVVRYWPSVGQELYADTSCELGGQECARLVASGSGLLLATTSCSLLILQPEPERPGVSCRQLRPPSGWLGGLGRRVSLLFFGSMPANADTKLVGVVVLQGGGGAPEGDIALVGGGGGAVLQLWRGAELHEHNLRRALTDAHRAQGDVNSLQVMCLDVRAGGPLSLMLLIAVVNVARSPEMRYAIAHMSVEDPANPRVTSLVPIRGPLSAECAPRLLPLPGAALLYTSTYVARVSSTVANDKVEYIDVASEGDRILGATLCNTQPLLFSRKHGVLALCTQSVTNNVSVCESPMGSPCPSEMYDGNLSLYEIDPHEVSMVTTDACGKLKTAFLFHLRRDTAACAALVDELFPAQRGRERDAALDRTVLRIAAELCDDMPQGDPRWKQRAGGPATNIPLGSSSALQITSQIRDKQRAFSLFADFLRAVGLWQRLGTVSLESGEESISTVSALGLLAEKLAIALALRKRQQSGDSQLIDAAVYQVVCGDDADSEEPEVEAALSSGALSPADVCFRRVTAIQRVLVALCAAPAQHDARALAAHAQHVASLLTSVLTEVHACRAQWQPRPLCPQLGPGALLPKLIQLHNRAVSQYGPNCPDVVQRASLYEATSLLADLILTEAEPLRRLGRHDATRRDVIQPYIDAGQTERAAVLAEKFKDFELLIEMCVRQDDMERLYSYIDKYSGEGVAEISFAYLMDRGGASTAQLVRSLGARYPARLHAWLQRAPARDPVRALHHLAARGYRPAAAVLAGLARAERDSVGRLAVGHVWGEGVARLHAWLQRAPARDPVRALHHLAARGYRPAAAVLAGLARAERDSVGRLAVGHVWGEGVARLHAWLQRAPARDPVRALHHLAARGYRPAAAVLAGLARAERDSVGRLAVGHVWGEGVARLHAWLQRAPARDPVRALHHLAARGYRPAAAVLAGLARAERDSVGRLAVGHVWGEGVARLHAWLQRAPARDPVRALHHLAARGYRPAAAVLAGLARAERDSVGRLAVGHVWGEGVARLHAWLQRAPARDPVRALHHLAARGYRPAAAVLAGLARAERDSVGRLAVGHVWGEGVARLHAWLQRAPARDPVRALHHLAARGYRPAAAVLAGLARAERDSVGRLAVGHVWGEGVARLHAWLQRAPARDPVRALHHLAARGYRPAAAVLAGLARAERDSVGRLAVGHVWGEGVARLHAWLQRAPARDPVRALHHLAARGYRPAAAVLAGLARAERDSVGRLAVGHVWGEGVARLHAWLQRAPARDPVRALHHLAARGYRPAAAVLAGLARAERDSVGRLAVGHVWGEGVARLHAWLQRAPARDPVRALHHLAARGYRPAAAVLAGLARAERDSVGRLAVGHVWGEGVARLHAWLQRAPARDPVRALHHLAARGYRPAAAVLAGLARAERDSVGRLAVGHVWGEGVARLHAWLQRAPARDPVRALHHLAARGYRPAAAVLAGLARAERDSVGRLAVGHVWGEGVARLHAWLQRAPARDPVRALHHLAARGYRPAAAVLAGLARAERDSVGRLAVGHVWGEGVARLHAWLQRAPARDPVRALHHLAARGYRPAAAVLAGLARAERDSVGRLAVGHVWGEGVARLHAWLQRAPARDPVRALHHLAARGYRPAAAVLAGLARAERDSVGRLAVGHVWGEGVARLHAWLQRAPARDPVRALHHLAARGYRPAAAVLAGLARAERDSVGRLAVGHVWGEGVARLHAWLQRAPARDPVRALHHLAARGYRPAAAVLAGLARAERDSVGRLAVGHVWGEGVARLHAWLQRAPARDPVRALHHLAARGYRPAAAVLAGLARAERDSVGRLAVGHVWGEGVARLHAWLQRAPARDPVRALHHLAARGYRPAAAVLAGLARAERDSVGRLAVGHVWGEGVARLHAWLQRAPARDPVRALHHLAARGYRPAAAVLAGLARAERDSVGRLATAASLAKLCLLASDEEPQPSDLWNKIEGCLSLADQHSALPRDIKLLHGLDVADCRVMSPEDLVQMYIESESDALTEYDYKKALDLTDFVQDMERRDDLRLRVWCACIRRSSWETVNIEAPAAELQEKMFFRLMHLVHFMGGDLELLLPPAEDILTARELAELVSDSRFRYIIKYGYECFHTSRQEEPIQA